MQQWKIVASPPKASTALSILTGFQIFTKLERYRKWTIRMVSHVNAMFSMFVFQCSFLSYLSCTFVNISSTIGHKKFTRLSSVKMHTTMWVAEPAFSAWGFNCKWKHFYTLLYRPRSQGKCSFYFSCLLSCFYQCFAEKTLK
jgi:hypothetical protein